MFEALVGALNLCFQLHTDSPIYFPDFRMFIKIFYFQIFMTKCLTYFWELKKKCFNKFCLK